MIDQARHLLADFSRCPACAAVLPGNRCSGCGLDLSGADGKRVGELSVRAGQVLAERDAVLQVMRIRAASRTSALATSAMPTPATAALRPIAPPAPPPVPPPVPTTSPLDDDRPGFGVHGLLVGLGAMLLSVAAVGFLVFSWSVLSLSGRATVIATATLGVLAVASWLRRRLPETAEAVGALGVVLVLADGWAVRRTGLFGADRPDGLAYAAAATAVSALLLGGWALISRVRAGSWAAVTLAPLSVLLLAAQLSGTFDAVPMLAIGFLLVAGLTLGRGRLPAGWRAERWLLRAIAVGALIGAGVPAGFGHPGSGRAALVLIVAAVLAAVQTGLDRATAVPGDRSLLLRRIWSTAAGLLAGMAALQAGSDLAEALNLDGISVLLPLTALPALAVLAAAGWPNRRGTAFRRSAFGAGTVLVAGMVSAPLVILAGWLPVRAALAGARVWSAEPGARFGDLDPRSSATLVAWAVALAGLAVVGGCALLAVRAPGLPGWPGWLRRPVRVAGAVAGGLGALILPLVPVFPLVAVVAGLILLSVLSSVLVAGPTGRVRSRTWLIAGWTAAGLTGTLAVVLAWAARDLCVPVTGIGIAALLLARRRLPVGIGTLTGPVSTGLPATGSRAAGLPAVGLASAGLAGLAAVAALFAVGATAGRFGATPAERLVWAGVIGGLGAAALIGLPRWLPAVRAGRADWTGRDRLFAAAGGLIALVIGLLATLPDGAVPAFDGSSWPRPALLGVALLIALTGLAFVRPAVAQALPVLPAVCALAATGLLGALAAAIRAVTASGDLRWPALSLLWAVAAGVGGFVIAAVVLTGRTDPTRRPAAEFGVIGTGLIGLSLVTGLDRLWPVLLVLGAAAAAIATTPDRRPVGWLAGLLLTGSTWSRLAVGNVSLIEAYSLPPAFALLALAGYRFWRDRETDPVRALLPVASVGLVPSIVVAATGSPVRAAVLIAVAAVLVLAGAQLQRRAEGDRPAFGVLLGAVPAAIGVVTAAGTAIVRAGVTLGELPDQATARLNGVELWTIPAALVLLFAAVTVKTIQPVGAVERHLSRAAAPPVLAAVLLVGVPTMVAARLGMQPYLDDVTDRWTVGRVGAVLGSSVLIALLAIVDRRAAERLKVTAEVAPGADRSASARFALVPGTVGLIVVATWLGLTIGRGPMEVWTLPLAVVLLVQGWSRFDRVAASPAQLRPGAWPTSWRCYGIGLAVLLLPSLLLGWSTSDGSAVRAIGLITLAGAVLVIGARYRLQAPVLFGASTLIVQAALLLRPWIAILGTIPLWGWLAVVGLGLILLGARYEARMRQLRAVRLRLAALR